MSGYDKIKQLAKEAGCTIPDLLVLARQNDPFFVGSPAQRKMAEWFAELWHEFGYTTGVHLRRFHYRLISQELPTNHNGEPYENTEGCWNDLCNAGKYARHLGLVDPAAFVDRRNPSPYIYMVPGVGELLEPGWDYEFPEWYLPKIRAELSSDADLSMPKPFTTGYNYDALLQPYHVEVWCEKSTMNDELIPVCQRHAANFVTGVGFMSITSVVQLLDRVSRLEKPCRILYISDFDPAGGGMPVSVARQAEYGIKSYAPELRRYADIKLDSLILTPEQVEEYSLPRIPIKDSDRRKGNFEAIHGTGAVELDALEALHPGELARIVERSIRGFRDEELIWKVDDAREEAEEQLSEIFGEHFSAHQTQLEAIREEVAEISESYQERLEELDNRLQAELAPYRARLLSLRQAIQDDLLEDVVPELPDLPAPEALPEGSGWLFDSRRDYLEQLTVYKQHQNGARGAA